MRRIFTEPVGRFVVGRIYDFPHSTWRGIPGWERVSIPVDDLLEQLADGEPVPLPDGSVLVRVTDRAMIERLLGEDAVPRRRYRRGRANAAQVPA